MSSRSDTSDNNGDEGQQRTLPIVTSDSSQHWEVLGNQANPNMPIWHHQDTFEGPIVLQQCLRTWLIIHLIASSLSMSLCSIAMLMAPYGGTIASTVVTFFSLVALVITSSMVICCCPTRFTVRIFSWTAVAVIIVQAVAVILMISTVGSAAEAACSKQVVCFSTMTAKDGTAVCKHCSQDWCRASKAFDCKLRGSLSCGKKYCWTGDVDCGASGGDQRVYGFDSSNDCIEHHSIKAAIVSAAVLVIISVVTSIGTAIGSLGAVCDHVEAEATSHHEVAMAMHGTPMVEHVVMGIPVDSLQPPLSELPGANYSVVEAQK